MANSSSSEHSTTALSPLDRRALEQTLNLKVLSVQVESARHELEKKRKEMEDLPAVHERQGKVCTVCHKQGHNKTKCTNMACFDVSVCKLKDKHPEIQNVIRSLQRDFWELEQKCAKAGEIKLLCNHATSTESSKSSKVY